MIELLSASDSLAGVLRDRGERLLVEQVQDVVSLMQIRAIQNHAEQTLSAANNQPTSEWMWGQNRIHFLRPIQWYGALNEKKITVNQMGRIQYNGHFCFQYAVCRKKIVLNHSGVCRVESE